MNDTKTELMHKIWNGLSLETLRHFRDSYHRDFQFHTEKAAHAIQMRNGLDKLIQERIDNVEVKVEEYPKNSDHIITGPAK